MILSSTIQAIDESKTTKITPLIQTISQQGKKIINFAVGEPEYDTPEAVIESTKDALVEQKTRYGPVPGLPELRARLAQKYDGYNSDNIIISNGAKQSLYSVFRTICHPGDEVIVPRPYWVSFPQQIKLAGGIPVFVDTKDHQLDCDAIEYAITPKTKIILINSPNNPTGAVYPKEDLEKIAKLAEKYNLYILSDEAYEHFIYDGLENEGFFPFKNIRDKLIIVGSFSKKYSMTGFRIGYVVAHEKIISAITKFQSHCSGNVCTFAQYGALAALSLDEQSILLRSELKRKRDIAYNYTSKLFDCIKPQGAFYLFPNISNYLNNKITSEDLSTYLLENAGVAVVPGEVFGMANHIRISYAVPEALLKEGFEKIERALRNL